MKNKLIIVSLLVFLLTGLSTSSFFLNEHLTSVISKKEHSNIQLAFAIDQKNVTALRFAWEKVQPQSKKWLKLTKELAKTQGDAAYQLALYYQAEFKIKPKQAIFWYKSAIRLNYLEASTGLALLYFQQGNLIKAAEVLDALPVELFEKLSDEAIILKVNIAINQGEMSDIQKITSKYSQKLKSSKEGLLLLKDIQKYQIQLSDNQVIDSSPLAMNCNNSIQLFATTVNHLKRLESLILDFKKQPLNDSVCFSPVRYMAIDSLDCTNEKDESIQCNEVNWWPWANSINTRYVGLMLPQGGANVHFGVLYLDAKDSVDVVAHEISHLLGFVDEYPLISEHVKCQTIQKDMFSQNISVLKNKYQGRRKVIRASILKQVAWSKHINNSTPILQSAIDLNGEHYWKLGTPEEFKHETGVFNAQTCNNSAFKSKDDFSAFKPVSYGTKLQYFSLNFPPLYSKFIQVSLNQFSMPSFHYNIALAYFQQAPLQQSSFQHRSIEKAKYWLEQAANREHDSDRQKKIRKGGF